MLTHLALLALTAVPAPATRHPAPAFYRPRVELWTNRGDAAVYTRGERVRVYFRLDRDAFVTVFRVDSDGRVRVLFPREPWEDNFARGDRDFELEGRSSGDAFIVDDYPGVGYIFAVAAADPFVYDPIESGDHWDYRVIAEGRIRGDPYVALTELAQRIVPEGYADWDYDIISYNVERHYDYPRFLCYDCHSYVSWPYWDPYSYSCVRFRIVLFDDPWYYPYRRYGGTRVVFVRPYRPQPRFIFKDWGTARPSRDGFVTRERERPENDNGRRGVTRRDIGIGVIPPPEIRDRREQPVQAGQRDRSNKDDEDRGQGRRDRPEQRDQREQRERPEQPDRPERPAPRQILPPRGEPERAEPRREEPRRVEPRREEPRRAEPRREEPRRAEPRQEPRREEPRRAEPRQEPRRDPPRAEPRRDPPRAQPPRAEPRREAPREAPKEKPKSEPELQRRKP